MSPINLALGPDGPSPDEWEAEQAIHAESTSARLRRVEQELRVALDDRDYFKEGTRVAHKAIDEVAATADMLRAELASARAELEQLRYSGWQVARAPLGRGCTACAREIQRGEAYSTDTTRDELRHVHCPTEGES
jgi:hypothetical protein